MSNPKPFVLRWGIISTGRIAGDFVEDILLDPKTRDVVDVIHKVVAVGSRTAGKAQEFIDAKAGGDKNIKAYENYADVYADPDVDAVYIATPHTFHYEEALAAIEARKHVLIEKPSTATSAELRHLLQIAEQKKVFVMEAMWTRFLPLTQEVLKVIDEEDLGRPITLHADLSGDFHIDKLSLEHRILNPRLGGGALLDLGPYVMVWAIICIFEHSSNHNSRPTSISGLMLKSPLTGVDTNTSFTLNFPDAQAILTASINVNSISSFGCNVRYERGTVNISSPLYCPKEFTVKHHDKTGRTIRHVTRFGDYVGGGWHFQADEVARCIRDGKKESEIWSHQKMILVMEVFDEVRRQGGYVFPPGVEKVVSV
ncbi:hypothetical protein AGABI1DRAFT_112061 [Agaricus bisporus var. burnettii JB137-S8]|uniref:D-xylose 1-dehydrogenase (NADP(+), D-xylono-1,5-lactone-forming) n=1 Tax=Agaricus bisporus var. burnettii (strain JB137-S8 / ATCC MYA-4627 / FGSC 10392) TaxID=597362 RepID=K5XEL4_AGABU|nr:uncharacterized protein AGABI1DRAFT_112061 [Agaricus bisporus var. burnettii JB137-S8]EKM81828.1 hypothetical protein AGABI1DRAFT_112061 [Agaricus bisporus var. burnettii JB137-S8]